MEDKIVEIMKKNGINVIRIDRVTNSFSSNVYIVYSNNEKFIFKILYNEFKQKEEAKYLELLESILNVPKLLFSGNLDDKYFNVMTFVEGKSICDEMVNTLSFENIYNIGCLLGKLHNVDVPDKNENSWQKYLIESLSKTYQNLKFVSLNDKVYKYLIKCVELQKNEYDNVLLHLDFRLGNIIFGDEIYLIDFESMKNGDSCFDFLKLYRILNKKEFKLFLKGYESIRKIPINLNERLEFYNIFDAYTSLNWCYERKTINSDFYNKNIKILERKFK